MDNLRRLTTDNGQTGSNHHKPPNEAPRRPVRRLIPLSTGEIRHLFNLIGKDDHTVDLGLYWSTFRRSHQAEARRRHFRRHLRLQIIQI